MRGVRCAGEGHGGGDDGEGWARCGGVCAPLHQTRGYAAFWPAAGGHGGGVAPPLTKEEAKERQIRSPAGALAPELRPVLPLPFVARITVNMHVM